jgi:hypothetical protein
MTGGIGMLVKLDGTIEELIAEGRIKTRWSELEDHGIAELVHVMFGYHLSDDSVGTRAVVENYMVFLDLFEGILYEHEGRHYTLAKVYIDIDNNLIFTTPRGELFLYETYTRDADDPKHYFGNE